MSTILSSGWPWALTVAGFAFLIIIHEFGHFIAAKATGMRVERFFLFFPPKIVSIKRGETEYGIGALPFGGFVKITGMNPDELKPAAADGEDSKPGGGLMTKMEGAGQVRSSEPLPPAVLKRAYDILFRSGHRMAEAARLAKAEFGDQPDVMTVLAFLEGTKRGICHSISKDDEDEE